MLPSDVGRLLWEGFFLAAVLALPLVGAALAAGLFSAFVQKLTRVSEPVIGLVPRLLGAGFAVIAFAPWMSDRVLEYARRVLSLVSVLSR